MASSMVWGRTEDKKYNGPCIYMFISASGKRYIGQTVNIRSRMHGHCSDIKRKKKNGKWKYTTYWANTVRKYGWKKLKLFILQKFHLDEPNLHVVLNRWEKYWIKWFRSYKKEHGYNANMGGNSSAVSAETKAKISAANKGKKNSFYGKKHSLESRAKMSTSHRGHTLSHKTRANMSVAHTGMKHSAETRAKMSVSAKMNRALNPRTLSAETKAKIGAASYKAVIVTFPNGEEKKFQSIKKAAGKLSTENVKFDRGAISSCCRGKYRHTKGYKFRFA